MRQIFLDTETTGLDPKLGNRVIEIGCVELLHRQRSGNNFHLYLNPGRDSEEGALGVHGLTTEFLSDKPKFADVVADFLDYINGAEVFIHNAPFDIGFLNAELNTLGLPKFETHVAGIVDTLVQAKQMYPGKRNSLDALCERHGISNLHRTLHGALLDAELLADVYLAMSRGQGSLSMDLLGANDDASKKQGAEMLSLPEVVMRPAAPEELAEHDAILANIDKQTRGGCVWLKLDES